MRFLSAQRNCLTAWLHHVHVLLVCLSCVIKTALFTLPCVCTENQGPSFRGLFGGDRIGDDAYCMFSEGVHVPGRWRLSVSFTAGPDRDSHSANAPLPRPRLPSYERQRRVEVHRGAVGTQRVRIYGWSWWHCVCVRASVVVHDFEELRPMLVPPSQSERKEHTVENSPHPHTALNSTLSGAFVATNSHNTVCHTMLLAPGAIVFGGPSSPGKHVRRAQQGPTFWFHYNIDGALWILGSRTSSG